MIIGVDEAGRGPLAGPVVACAVAFKASFFAQDLLNDSKKLSLLKRQGLYKSLVTSSEIIYALAEVDHKIIDELNILEATKLAMKKAVLEVVSKCSQEVQVLVDGNQLIPSLEGFPQKAVIKGDTLIKEIMAASILAKVHRDTLMSKLHEQYPQYGFKQHKGYGTKIHMEALQKYGPCPVHRVSFRPVKDALASVVKLETI